MPKRNREIYQNKVNFNLAFIERHGCKMVYCVVPENIHATATEGI